MGGHAQAFTHCDTYYFIITFPAPVYITIRAFQVTYRSRLYSLNFISFQEGISKMFVTKRDDDIPETSPAGRIPGWAHPCVVRPGGQVAVLGLPEGQAVASGLHLPTPAPLLLRVCVCVYT